MDIERERAEFERAVRQRYECSEFSFSRSPGGYFNSVGNRARSDLREYAPVSMLWGIWQAARAERWKDGIEIAVPVTTQSAQAPAPADLLRAIMRTAEAAKEPCGSDPESPAAIRNGALASIAGMAAQGLGLVRGPAPAQPAPSCDPRTCEESLCMQTNLCHAEHYRQHPELSARAEAAQPAPSVEAVMAVVGWYGNKCGNGAAFSERIEWLGKVRSAVEALARGRDAACRVARWTTDVAKQATAARAERAEAAQRVPQGWKLVPVGPTQDMLIAGSNAASGFGSPLTRTECAYHAMLAAAPEAPQAAQRVPLTDAQIERIAQETFRVVQDMPDDKVNGSTWDRCFARAIEAAHGITATEPKGEQR